MYLALDNSLDTKVVLYYTNISTGDWFKKEYVREDNNNLLYFIDLFLKENKINLNEFKGLAVLAGQGRFTLTRTATTVFNILSFACGIPVATFYSASDLPKLEFKVGKYILPSYSGEANIGHKS